MNAWAVGKRRFVALALITILLAISSGDRATLSVAGPSMTKALGISAVELGWLFSSFAWAYVLAQVPAGLVVDRIGTRHTILGSLALWSLTTLAMGGTAWFAQPFFALLVMRFLLGAFESPVGAAGSRTIAAWFPTAERGMAGGIFNSAQYISLVLFIPLMGWLDHAFGWKHIFAVMGVLGLGFVLIWFLLYHGPAHDPRLHAAELAYIRDGGALVELGGGTAKSPARKPSLGDLAQIFRSRLLVGLFVMQYCVAGITWFFVSWFPTYLVTSRGLSVLQASLLATVPALFGFVGGVGGGFASDWLLRRGVSLSLARKGPITFGLVLSALMIGCNYTTSAVVTVALMSVAFFGKGFGALGFTVIADVAPKQIIGLTGGVFNALGNAAGMVTPVMIGYLVAGTGSFELALLYVGLHGLVATFAVWVIAGPIRRVDLLRLPAVPHSPLALAHGAE